MPIVKTTSFIEALTLLFVLFACSALQAQEPQEAQPAVFLHANDRFGARLLSLIHEEAPDRNIAIAPLPISLAFAALLNGSVDSQNIHEIISTFSWDRNFSRDIAGRMLLARFEKPKSNEDRISTQQIWFSTALVYRGKESLSQTFMDRARYYFGLDFREVGVSTPQSTILSQNWDSSLPMPAISDQNDFWITSFLHLRTTWAGNIFVDAKRKKEDFKLHSGSTVRADFLKSETTTYRYAQTKDFEAIVLPGWEASILLVLPGQDTEIGQLMASMVKNPDMVESLLKRQQGDVRLPPFHLSYDVNLREPLESMGVHRIFQNPAALFSMAPEKNGAQLEGIAQGESIIVDEHGIRADAGTLMSGIYGGIELLVPSPFHMVLNRPFLFLIRDNATNALLFSGVVMDPTAP